VEGTLTLNDVNVRCLATLDLATLNDAGHLIALAEVHGWLTRAGRDHALPSVPARRSADMQRRT